MITGDERKSTVNRGLPFRPLRYILYPSIGQQRNRLIYKIAWNGRMRRTYEPERARLDPSLEEEGEMVRTIFTFKLPPKEQKKKKKKKEKV